MSSLAVNDYVFYKIVCIDENIDFSYVGSTKNLRRRKSEHKTSCNNPNDSAYNNLKYQIIRSNGGWQNFKLVELGKREQITQREAQYIEEEYRLELRANMNRQRCYRTEEERIVQSREKSKAHREKNPEYHKEYKKEYRSVYKESWKEKMTCECGSIFRIDTKLRHERSKKHIRFVEKKV